MIPGFYISLLGFISLYCLSYIVRHPHDIRTGEKKIRDAYLEEHRRREEKEGGKGEGDTTVLTGAINESRFRVGKTGNAPPCGDVADAYSPPDDPNRCYC